MSVVLAPPEPETPPFVEDAAPYIPEPTAPLEGVGLPSTSVIPHDIEAEQAVIGAVLIDHSAFKRVSLDAADFYIHRNRWIWEAFVVLRARGDSIDILTVSGELKRSGKLEEIGGDAYLVALLNDCPTSLHAESYARTIKDMAARRKMLTEANDQARRAFDLKSPIVETAGPRYIVHDAADALAQRPPVKWIVEGLIYEKSVTVIYGDGGTKKTWSSMHLAACVASGAPWGDFKTNRERVLFVDEENGDDEIADRAGRCIRGALSDESADLHYISLAAFHLDNPQDEALLAAEILVQDAKLVIFDALADLMLGDENSKQDTQPVFNAMRRIVEKTGAAILVIHHANKQGGHRGSSVIKDAPDILLQVVSDQDSNYVNFKTEKNRKGKAVKWSMYATWSDDSFYLTTAEAQEKAKPLSKSQDYVIRFLTEHGASPIPAIMAGADTCSPEAARKAVYNLADLQKIYRTNPGDTGQGIAAIYDLKAETNESVL